MFENIPAPKEEKLPINSKEHLTNDDSAMDMDSRRKRSFRTPIDKISGE